MKKVIFLCLLSLSVCLSKAAEEKASTPPAANATTDPKTTAPVEHASPHEESQPISVINNVDKKNDTKTDKVAPPTTLPQVNTTKPESDNKTADKNLPKEESVKPSSNETKVVPEKANKEMKPEEKPKNDTSTEKATVKPTEATKPTEAPKVTESPKPMHIIEKARGFDGPSFIGGIILTLGLLAIGFMGFKYYKNQTERNYHTL